MESKMSDRGRFNLFLDGIIENVSQDEFISMRYRDELFKFISCIRQVGEYDVRLVSETYLAGLTVTYGMGRWLIDRFTKRAYPQF